MTDYLKLARRSAARRPPQRPTPPPRNPDRDESDKSDESAVEPSFAVPVADVAACLAEHSALPGSARRALQDALLSDARLRARFETVCMDSTVALRGEVLTFRAALKKHGHAFGDYRREYEETAEALYALAGELLPESPAAASAGLRELVDVRRQPRTGKEAVEGLAAAEHEFYDELVMLSGEPPQCERLRAVSQRIWDALRERGQRHEPQGFSDHVWMAVREAFPYSSGAAWDEEWSKGLSREVLADFTGRLREAGLDYTTADTGSLEAAFQEMAAAEECGDRPEFRGAARRAVAEGRKIVREAARLSRG